MGALPQQSLTGRTGKCQGGVRAPPGRRRDRAPGSALIRAPAQTWGVSLNAVRAFVVAVLALAGLAVPPGPSQSAVTAAVDLPGSLFASFPVPVRILDTRTGIDGHRGQVDPGETVTFAVPGLPADATAVAVNLTGIRVLQENCLWATNCYPVRSNVI